MPPRDPRREMSSMSVGLQWASTITTIGLEMALPPLAGIWLDRHFDTMPVLTLTLTVFGFLAAMLHLWGIAQRLSPPPKPPRDANRSSGPPSPGPPSPGPSSPGPSE